MLGWVSAISCRNIKISKLVSWADETPAAKGRNAFTGLEASVLVTGLGCGLKDRGDVVCGVEPPGRNVDYQVVGGIVGQGQAAAVEAVEGERRPLRP